MGRSRSSARPPASDGKGLGVVALDFDDDGDSDLYVANDTTRNYLYRNDGGTLTDVGVEAGVAYNEQGLAEAGMGVDAGDVDRDGRLDLVVTNFDFENNTLYRNLGGGFFFDATSAFGLGAVSLTELGFGCDFLDLDNDGWLDLVVVNGHILDNIAEIQSNLSFAQPGQVFRNEGGRFRDVTASSGSIAKPRVGRGLASLDYDRDGDRDLAIASRGGAAELLRNDGRNEGAFVSLRLVGIASNRDGVGARLSLELEGRPWVEELRSSVELPRAERDGSPRGPGRLAEGRRALAPLAVGTGGLDRRPRGRTLVRGEGRRRSDSMSFLLLTDVSGAGSLSALPRRRRGGGRRSRAHLRRSGREALHPGDDGNGRCVSRLRRGWGSWIFSSWTDGGSREYLKVRATVSTATSARGDSWT